MNAVGCRHKKAGHVQQTDMPLIMYNPVQTGNIF